jgi:NAD+ kinase
MRTPSKRLGSLMLKLNVKNVLLVTKAHDDSLVSLTREVTQWLLSKDRDAPLTVYVERRFQDHPDFNASRLIDEEPSANGRLKYWDSKLAPERPHMFDFVVTLGGDGTVLYTSWLFQRTVPPVLSFALGSLGFLTKFDYNDFRSTLTNAFRDGVVISLRLRFECTVMRSNHYEQCQEGSAANRDLVEELIGEEIGDRLTHTPDKVFEILNDVVVGRGPNPSMSPCNCVLVLIYLAYHTIFTIFSIQRCLLSSYLETMSILQPSRLTAFASRPPPAQLHII